MVRWCDGALKQTMEKHKWCDGALKRTMEKHKWRDGAMVRCFSIFTCARQRKDGERLDEFDD